MPLTALLQSAAFAPIQNLGWIKVTGPDRTRWLNGMVTNNTKDLAPGQANYNFVLSNQGRIQADLNAFAFEDHLLLQTGLPRIPALIELLDRFIIMDDVELAPLNDLAGILIAGPHALSIVQSLGAANQQAALCSSPPHAPNAQVANSPDQNLKQTLYAGAPVSLIHAHSPLVPRFEIWSDSSTIAAILAEVTDAQIPQATSQDLEYLRVLEGTPLYGTDIRDKELPQETTQMGSQSRALHFSKGCYLGQEIVERINSRGAVHRTFSGFLLTGDLPPAGTALTSDGKPVGELTSIAHIDLPGGPIQMALGYIRREIIERGAQITYPGGTAIYLKLPAGHARPQ